MNTAPPANCFECGVALSPGHTSGLCLKCMLRTGIVSQLSPGSFPNLAPGITPDAGVREAFEFGGYRILSLLGRGGMGAVYEAEQTANRRPVALKVLGTSLATPEMHARFVCEGRLAAAVRHPNVVAVFAAEEIEGTAVIAMEMVPAGTLTDRICREGPMLPGVVMRCLAKKANGRFENYTALRTALLPFRSAAPVPAQPGLRFVAGLMDLLMMITPSLVFHSAKGSEAGMLIERSAASVGVYLAFVAWEIFCVCLPEGLWGAGLGKAVCGLRVVVRGGGVPGVMRAVARGIVLALAMHLGDAATWIFRTPAEYHDEVVKARFLPEEMLGVLLLVLLFVSMRRRNGLVAVQDLLTGTRVIFAPVSVSRLPIPDAPANQPTQSGKRVGPFVVTSREGEWIFARDEALDRRVG